MNLVSDSYKKPPCLLTGAYTSEISCSLIINVKSSTFYSQTTSFCLETTSDSAVDALFFNRTNAKSAKVTLIPRSTPNTIAATFHKFN